MQQEVDFSTFPDITTARLLLRPPNLEDASVIFFQRTDTQLNKYIKRVAPQSMEDIYSFINDRLADRKNGAAIYWCISPIDNPRMCIGAISLWHFSKDRLTGEVGYDLHPDWQGKGIMDEALKAVLDFGYTKLNLKFIEAFTHFENSASIKLLLSNDFTLATERRDTGNVNNRIYTHKAL